MDQVIDNKPKIEVMRSSIDGLLASPPPNKLSRAVVFGSRPQLGCEDIQISSGSSKELSQYLHKVRPGEFGKTPLSKGLEYIMERAVKEDYENIVAITDGADSCRRDPCEVLNKSDAELSKINKKIELMVIGIDLKNESKRFSCFKDKKLKSIRVNLVEASSQSAIEEALRQMRRDALLKAGTTGQLSPSLSDRQSQQKKSSSKQSSASDSGDNAVQKKRKENISVSVNKDPNLCTVEVIGAPEETEFSLIAPANDRVWRGQIPIELTKTKFVIKQNNQKTQLDLECTGGEYFKIPWASLLDQPFTTVSVVKNIVQLRFDAEASTQMVHGQVELKKMSANLTGRADDLEMEFGKYLVNVDSPQWFKGKIKPKSIELKALQQNQVDVLELFKSEIKVVKNPYSNRDCVMKLSYPDGQIERHLVEKGQVNIPVPRYAKIEFLIPR